MQSPRIAFHYLPASQPMSTGLSDIPDLDDTIFENMFGMRLPSTHATQSTGFPIQYGTHDYDAMSDPIIDDVPATASERCALPDDDFSMSIDELYSSMCSASDFACFDPVKQAEDDARIAALDAADAARAVIDVAMEDAVSDSDSDSDEDSDDDLACFLFTRENFLITSTPSSSQIVYTTRPKYFLDVWPRHDAEFPNPRTFSQTFKL
ncbi:hypothetical protein R3P38DRAFT_2761875 [Favolaschia claudopus]|uniref:Uncharacterized protein n=1 Tax=Favolaschia claudopus TaxID=2862362 RepID=A0AAW0DT46_9AGAR